MKRIILALLFASVLQACGSKDTGNDAAKAQADAAAANRNADAATQSTANAVISDDTEKLFQNPFDPDAVYLLSQRSGTSTALKVLIKRDSQAGTQYSRWQFNCAAQTAQNLGVASNVQDLEKSGNSMPTAPQRYEAKSRLGAIAGAVCPK